MQITGNYGAGPAALVTNRTGAGACFWLDSASFVFSAAVIFTIRIQPQNVPSAKAVSSVLADLAFGGHHIFTHSVLAFSILSMAAGGFAISCYNALIATYARDVLHGSTELFGLLGTAVALGMLLGTHGISRLGRLTSKEHLLLGSVALRLAFYCWPLPSRRRWQLLRLSVWALVLLLSYISAQTLIQLATPVELLGRVSGSLRSVLALVQIAGLLLSGRSRTPSVFAFPTSPFQCCWLSWHSRVCA